MSNLPPGSAVMRETHPDLSEWGTAVKTNAILADIYDVLSNINANLIAIGTGKPAKKPKPYPRPGKHEDNEKRIGRGALPPDELREWIKEKSHARSSKRNANSDAGPAGGTAVTD